MTLPVLFVGHGSPMNAITDNEYSRSWKSLGTQIQPEAILTISAHWMGSGIAVTAMDKPTTIHDFYGFPESLFSVTYPAPGSPELADRVAELLAPTTVHRDQDWGLDHGTWSVLAHMYGKADIPVIQLSLDADRSPTEHYELGRLLRPLRDEGVLILASGDIVHNLGRMEWGRKDGFDWALRVNEHIKDWILKKDHTAIIACEGLDPDFKQAIPTPEHFWPLLYAIGASQDDDPIEFFTDSIVFGSVSMTGVKFGV